KPGRVFQIGIARGALSICAEQPRRGNKATGLQPNRAKFVASPHDPAQRFLVIKIIKLALVLCVEPRKQPRLHGLVGAALPLMEIAVNDNFMSSRFEVAQPGNKLSILACPAFMMVIRYDQKRAITDSTATKHVNDLLDYCAIGWCDVVNRHHERI